VPLLICFASILLSCPYAVWVCGTHVVEVGLLLVLAVRVGSFRARHIC
jgi:hypothetical protein